MEDTETAAVQAITLQASNPRSVALGENGQPGVPFMILASGQSVHDLEKTLPAPLRKNGTTKLRDLASFLLFVKQETTPNTRLYGTYDQPGFTAVFDDTRDGGPAWRDHMAVYNCPLSVEWKTWTAANKKAMNQETFAQFIEDNAPDCVQPASADMIEIARTLEAKKKVNFASGIRLSNGQNEFTYEEEISGTASKGKLQIPETFMLGIPVLEGGAPYQVSARLRYRIADGGKLAMWFDLERPHKILEDAVREVWSRIEADTGMAIFNGTPAV